MKKPKGSKDDLDYAELDPGIREIVRRLREAGFDTTDSGDGKSKPKAARVFDVPHVHMMTTPGGLIVESTRLAHLLMGWGIAVEQGQIQATYDPIGMSSLISLYNVIDSDFSRLSLFNVDS